MDEIGGVNVIDRAEHVIHHRCQMIHAQFQMFILIEHMIQIKLLILHDDEQVFNRVFRFDINFRKDDIINFSGKAISFYLR